MIKLTIYLHFVAIAWFDWLTFPDVSKILEYGPNKGTKKYQQQKYF